ncbi:unnamed protein product [Angiostrongylus costaricensis]|uniref:Secreted protein n=1 Tax=Angiostrongylus costaricensis TaxID=334426 RepID=A0A0R3PGX0_ANGCS|nr:unnamed protein product [Angiostrongylus costaricensis]
MLVLVFLAILANLSRTGCFRYVPSRTSKRNRMCLINAGLSQGCDLSDILDLLMLLLVIRLCTRFVSFHSP